MRTWIIAALLAFALVAPSAWAAPAHVQSLSWAITNENAYNQFTPPSVPSGAPSDLYDGCSGGTLPDGVGRLKAGQRYIYDFMVRREGLNFLTFDSQGWAVRYWLDSSNNWDVSDAADYPGNQAYAQTLFERANNFANFYHGDHFRHASESKSAWGNRWRAVQNYLLGHA